MKKPERKTWWQNLRLDISPVVRALTISDIFIVSGFGLISPIMAIFLTNNIRGGSIEVVGIATTIHLLTKSLGQLPAAKVIDKIKGERDDFWAMVIGSFALSLVPLLYLVASDPIHIYFIQFIYGLAQAFIFPAWMAIFTRHIDATKEGMEWGIYYTLVDLSGAGAAAIGATIASLLGFAPLFIIISLMSFIGSFWLLAVYEKMKKR